MCCCCCCCRVRMIWNASKIVPEEDIRCCRSGQKGPALFVSPCRPPHNISKSCCFTSSSSSSSSFLLSSCLDLGKEEDDYNMIDGPPFVFLFDPIRVKDRLGESRYTHTHTHTKRVCRHSVCARVFCLIHEIVKSLRSEVVVVVFFIRLSQRSKLFSRPSRPDNKKPQVMCC